jgi:predicted MFS family arabinose efflux permease
VPIGLAAIALALRVLPTEQGAGLRSGTDVLGAVLVTADAMLAVYSIVQAQQLGWGSARVLTLTAATVVLLATFLARQAAAALPLLPLRLLRSGRVVGANLIQLLLLAAMFSFQVQIALYLQKVLHQSALATGLAMLPAALAIGACSLGLSARLIGRFGERAVLLAGLALLLAARLLLIRLPVHGSYLADLLPVMLLTGGGGLAFPALTGIGMAGAEPRDAGVASGLFNTTQQLGAALGVAALSTVAASRTARLTQPGIATEAALTGGYRLAFEVGAGLLLAAIAATVALPGRRQVIGESLEKDADPAPASMF